MKVTFKYGIQTYSGEIDKMVYGSYRNDKLCLGRNYVYPALDEHHHKLGAIGRNMALLFSGADSLYRDNFKTYATANGKKALYKDRLVPSGYAMFVKMMQAWQKSDMTHVDLATVTIAEIVALDADVRTIARAVEAGFLPTVFGYDVLTGDIL